MTSRDRYEKYIFTRSVAWRLKLDEWEDSQLEDVLKTVDQAKSEIIEELEERLARHPRRHWTEDRLRSLLDELQDMTAGIKEQLGENLDDIATTAATKTVEEYNDIFSIDGNLPKFNNVELSSDQLRAMVQTPLGGLKAAEVVRDAFDHNIVDRVKQDIDAGLLRGESYRKLVDRVESNWGGTRSDITSIVRTQVQEMNNRAGWAVADKNQDILQQTWIWSAILDNRACMSCMSLDGREFDKDDDISIPYHISCRCLRRWQTKSWAEITEGEVDMDEVDKAMRNWVWRDGRVGVGGAVAEELGKFQGTYKDFFLELSREKQAQIIGPSRVRALMEGEIDFDDLTTYRGEIKTLKELGIKEKRKLEET